MKIDKKIQDWFNNQHYQSVMLLPDWKNIILKEKLYTEEVVLELLQIYSERQATTEVSKEPQSKALRIGGVVVN